MDGWPSSICYPTLYLLHSFCISTILGFRDLFLRFLACRFSAVGARVGRGKGAKHPRPPLLPAHRSVGGGGKMAGDWDAPVGHPRPGEEVLQKGCPLRSPGQGIFTSDVAFTFT